METEKLIQANLLAEKIKSTTEHLKKLESSLKNDFDDDCQLWVSSSYSVYVDEQYAKMAIILETESTQRLLLELQKEFEAL